MKQFVFFVLLFSLSIQIDIKAFRGESLFNKNIPVIINIESPEDSDDKDSNVDLICVIDVSGSMGGEKIEQVKSSLLTLVDMMGSKDRIGLVLFNGRANQYLDFTYVSNENKGMIKKKIETIKASGGTSILKGLEIAVNMLNEIKLFSTSVSFIPIKNLSSNN